MGVHVLEVVGLLICYVIILAIGVFASWWKNRRNAAITAESGEEESTSKTERIIVARRDIGMIVGGFTMTATWVGGGYINGTSEVFFTQGLVWAQAPIGYTLSLILGGLIYAKPMRAKRYLTMLDPFQQRYGERIGGLMYIPAVIGELFWSAAILAALGASISVIMGLEFKIATIISAAFAVLYTVVGGLYSVTYTDMAQMVFIIFGLVLSVPFVWHNPNVHLFDDAYFLNHTTYYDNSTNTTVVYKPNWIGSIQPNQIGYYIDSLLLLIFGGIPWQIYFQRVLCTKTIESARHLSYLGALGCALMAIPPALLGIAAQYADWDAAGYDSRKARAESTMVLPLVLQYLTPTAVAFFGLSSVSAAVMSSADGSILSASSMFANNIYRAIFRQKASDRETIWVIRVAIVCTGCLACLLAIVVQSVAALWVFCSDLVYVILFPQLTCVLFCPFANRYGALAGYVVGMVLRLIGGEPSFKWPPLVKYPLYDEATGLQLFPYKTLAALCNLIVLLGVSWITERFIVRRRRDRVSSSTNGGGNVLDDKNAAEMALRTREPKLGLDRSETIDQRRISSDHNIE